MIKFENKVQKGVKIPNVSIPLGLNPTLTDCQQTLGQSQKRSCQVVQTFPCLSSCSHFCYSRVPGHWVPAAYLEKTWCGVWQIFLAEQREKYFSTDICDPSLSSRVGSQTGPYSPCSHASVPGPGLAAPSDFFLLFGKTPSAPGPPSRHNTWESIFTTFQLTLVRGGEMGFRQHHMTHFLHLISRGGARSDLSLGNLVNRHLHQVKGGLSEAPLAGVARVLTWEIFQEKLSWVF